MVDRQWGMAKGKNVEEWTGRGMSTGHKVVGREETGRRKSLKVIVSVDQFSSRSVDQFSSNSVDPVFVVSDPILVSLCGPIFPACCNDFRCLRMTQFSVAMPIFLVRLRRFRSFVEGNFRRDVPRFSKSLKIWIQSRRSWGSATRDMRTVPRWADAGRALCSRQARRHGQTQTRVRKTQGEGWSV